MKNKLIYIAVILLFVVFVFNSCKKDLKYRETKSVKTTISEILVRSIATKFKSPSKSPRIGVDSTFFANRTIGDIYSIDDFNGIPAIYVINYEDNAGFLMLSAEPFHEPVLAFSEEGEILEEDTINPGFECWLEKTISSIMTVRYGEYDNLDRAYNGWIELLNQTGLDEEIIETVFANPTKPKPTDLDPVINPCRLRHTFQFGPLVQTEWGQDWRFGAKIGMGSTGCTTNSTITCTENAGIPWTGCVATAMAQVMRYWQVPNTYNYSIIPLKAYATGWNTTAVDEAGKILWDAGKSVCMNYGCNGSGAQMDDMDDGFKNNFSYASADYLSSFSLNDLVTNIANDKPIILSGCAKRDQLSQGWWIFKHKYYYSSECHAWVCDGIYGIKLYRLNYNENSLCSSFYFYHMNWGWNGDLNGWYYWNDWSSGIIVPSPENTSLPTLINDNYQYAKHQISNIHP